MKNIKTIAILAALLAFLGVVGSGMLLERIGPATIGVKQNLLGGGIVQKAYGMGYHVGIIGVHRWHRLDGRVHFLNFTQESASKRTRNGNVEFASALDIRTSDNNTASLDVTVLYEIIDEQAWMLVNEGLTLAYQDRVRQAVEGLLREELSKLSPEDFVNTDVRLARAEESLPLLRETLRQYHVEPLGILIRAVRFPPEYEEKLQLKQLTRQNSMLATARQAQERQQQQTQSIEKITEAMEKEARGEWDKRLQEAQSENQVQIAQIKAEAEVYARTTTADADATQVTYLAEGQLAVEQAEALRDELRNRALDTVGGRILLARQAAENLDVREVTLNSNDPAVPTIIDVDQLVRLLVGSGN
ncbi:SPFH domain-containing protein [Engelhardtia mirabilis]|uniref:SPFH domain / Band 7 family protein n=1 Tax=Engelhardtia mirabilis TaxID=2528011 RepID=A0A518BHQ9_9BACT|nr:SPFH domain / Band 7 family protein [Planctomycetes bacterium Pla133]QDV00843.1 SPFH domain / Band 7 family protein [Planctomycetes bacterium Pla86]